MREVSSFSYRDELHCIVALCLCALLVHPMRCDN